MKLFFTACFIYIVISLTGCSSSGLLIDPHGLKEGQKISSIVLMNGTEVDFSGDPLNYAFYKSGKIERFSAEGKIERYDLQNIKSIYFNDNKLDPSDPALWIISIPVVLIITAAALFK